MQRKLDRIDDIGMGGFKVVQGDGFSYGIDAVLLAAFASGETGAKPIKSRLKMRVADLGTGNGIIPFVLAHKLPMSEIVGFERNPISLERAVRGREMNELEDRINFVLTDISQLDGYDETFDAVVTNPPYFRRGAGIPNEDSAKFIARHETTAGIAEFAKCGSRILKSGGDFYMIHRPSRLPDISQALRAASLEPKELQLVVPSSSAPANLVLIHAVAGAKPDLKMLPEIAVYNSDGSGYTELIKRIYM
ncbi:methyltransferase [Mogibacterium neglectum]|uniref:tRNA1(Val) (adenine(37)-N6)-methyltransferase n=1 Tax=Mogibacterium neglectum TaxID=114528 RepID=UPI00272ACA2C|nr:methyltransferase [Mogibacterium neglectum]WLD75862.1 methyltransferase [Mogibacterium neglectum]